MVNKFYHKCNPLIAAHSHLNAQNIIATTQEILANVQDMMRQASHNINTYYSDSDSDSNSEYDSSSDDDSDL